MTKNRKNDASFHESDGWEEVGSKSDALAWEKGTIVVGTFLDMSETTFENEDGSKALVSRFETTDGEVAYWTPAILKNRLSLVPTGTEVRIECMGKVRTRSGRNAWDFKVMSRKK